MPSSLLFWDVDTQFDFMHPAGKLYVSGAETIISNLQRLTAFAVQHGIPIVASTDAHLETDPEFSQYPPHCLAGTSGQKKVEGTLFPHHLDYSKPQDRFARGPRLLSGDHPREADR